MMRSLLCFLLYGLSTISFGISQKLRKTDKEVISSLQTEISFLTSDKLEGRRSGTTGELLASEYIASLFQKTGIAAYGDSGTYFQKFEIYDGRDISHTHLSINSTELLLDKEYFPLPFSANGKIGGSPAIALQESGLPWFIDLKDIIESSQSNPHFDLMKWLRDKTKSSEAKGADAVIFYNSSKIEDHLSFDGAEGIKAENIPALFVTSSGRKKFLRDVSQSLDVDIDVEMEEKKRWGHNVVGFLNNGAIYTVVIGAHYDHLGYGEDGNSLYQGTQKAIHPGADDNASGTAALLELTKMLKKMKKARTNYLFVAFSGEESGLIGSKYFIEHPPVPLQKISFMVNMDMIGRLNDSTHKLTVGGYGTSPQWPGIINSSITKTSFSLNVDSSGTGPSDHTSFYLKNIPVLFFFTGLHPDYHKPTDQASKINYIGEFEIIRFIYDLLDKMDGTNKPSFTKTRDKQFGVSPAFNVTLGIMPDYSFSGSGVRIDAISEGRPAEKAGLKAGDIIVKLGSNMVSSLQTYMEALAKFNREDQTTVEYIRGNVSMKADVQFK